MPATETSEAPAAAKANIKNWVVWGRVGTRGDAPQAQGMRAARPLRGHLHTEHRPKGVEDELYARDRDF